jgi:hypothetical protein
LSWLEYGALSSLDLTKGAGIVTLVTKGKEKLASRAVNSDSSVNQKAPSSSRKKEHKKLSTAEAAEKILGIIECDMEHKKLSEEEKNTRAGRFASFVDRLTANRRKS